MKHTFKLRFYTKKKIFDRVWIKHNRCNFLKKIIFAWKNISKNYVIGNCNTERFQNRITGKQSIKTRIIINLQSIYKVDQDFMLLYNTIEHEYIHYFCHKFLDLKQYEGDEKFTCKMSSYKR